MKNKKIKWDFKHPVTWTPGTQIKSVASEIKTKNFPDILLEFSTGVSPNGESIFKNSILMPYEFEKSIPKNVRNMIEGTELENAPWFVIWKPDLGFIRVQYNPYHVFRENYLEPDLCFNYIPFIPTLEDYDSHWSIFNNPGDGISSVHSF